MSDGREMTPVPTKTLVRQGTTGIGGIVGGAALLILNAFGPIGGAIVGGILAIGGLGVAAASKEDRIAGGIAAGAGVLTILSGFSIGIGSTLLTISGIGLLIAGGFGLFKFIRGLRSRK